MTRRIKFLLSHIKLLAAALAIMGLGIFTDIIQAQEIKQYAGCNQDKKDSIQKTDTTLGIINAMEVMPYFPGGDKKLYKFISTNMQYPQKAINEKIEGRVICGFIVNKDGSVSDVEVLRSVHPLLDAEALRIIKLLPKWIPGMQSGKPVRVRYTLPVPFILPKGK